MATDYQFTSQRNEVSLGLYFYNARWYDGAIGRFTSADTIVGFDRYQYANNDPLRYIDPSGHVSCTGSNWDDGPQCKSKPGYVERAKSDLRSTLKKKYHWNVASDFTLGVLNAIFQTGRDIENYVNGLTHGKGLAWMNAYMGNTDFVKWDGANNQTWPGWATESGENTIYVTERWATKRWIAHELSHVWDMNTAPAVGLVGAHGGVGDDLNTFVGGHIADSILNCRYCNDSGAYMIPKDAQYTEHAYANNSTADYLAETFTFQIYPGENPGGEIRTGSASSWVQVFIMNEASELP